MRAVCNSRQWFEGSHSDTPTRAARIGSTPPDGLRQTAFYITQTTSRGTLHQTPQYFYISSYSYHSYETRQRAEAALMALPGEKGSKASTRSN